MAKDELNLNEALDMFKYIATGMLEKKDFLTKADQLIGDGDHGIGMARGFEAVALKLEKAGPDSIGDLLKTIGMTLMMSIGGAAGAIFGTFFKAAQLELQNKKAWDVNAIRIWLHEGLGAVMERGKAKPGDKTMIDSLWPAEKAAQEANMNSLLMFMDIICQKAKEGMESTKNFVATTGKAKTLGERSLGHADPGSISMFFILELMADYIKAKV